MGPVNQVSQVLYEGMGLVYTIFFVQFFYLEGIISLADHIVIELVPQSGSRELGTRELRQGTEVDAIHSASNKGKYKAQEADKHNLLSARSAWEKLKKCHLDV
jgi:hypothetical protein